MTTARLVITAAPPAWAQTAGQVVTGYASSVIGCDAEAGVERILTEDETDDGRPGVSVLLFGFSRDALQKAVVSRVGQCILTCATTACYNGLPIVKGKTIRVGVEAVAESSPMGRLRGTDNQVAIYSKRYKTNPLVVTGPGAGAEVTGAGVLNDIVAITMHERRKRPR